MQLVVNGRNVRTYSFLVVFSKEQKIRLKMSWFFHFVSKKGIKEIFLYPRIIDIDSINKNRLTQRFQPLKMNQQVINRIMDQTFEDRTMSMLSLDKDVPVALRLRRMKRRLFLERTTSKGSVSESSTEEDSPSSQARRVSQSSL